MDSTTTSSHYGLWRWVQEEEFRQCTLKPLAEKANAFALIPIKHLEKLVEDAEMLSPVRAYDAAKAGLETGEDELIPLEITQPGRKGEAALPIWREHR
jgi:hypothetical protein